MMQRERLRSEMRLIEQMIAFEKLPLPAQIRKRKALPRNADVDQEVAAIQAKN